jgi:hypothetical protein
MLHDLYQVRAKPTRPKGGSNPTLIGGQPYEKEQRNQKEAKAEENQTNDKRKDTKSCFHTTKEKQIGVETKRRSSKVHPYTTKNKQDDVETKERAAFRIHFSGSGTPSTSKK